MLNAKYVDGLALKSSFESLLEQFQVEPRAGKRALFDLVRAYSSGSRFYHNLGHVQEVLQKIEELRSLPGNFPAIQLAAWFHDAIYDPKSKNNEQKSAHYAADTLARLGLPGATIDTVSQMILGTKHQQETSEDIDSHILLDADLAILGEEDTEYRFYAVGIRREYSWLSDTEYCEGRIQVLENFLKRDRIYFTESLFETLEEKARQNLRSEIEALYRGGEGYSPFVGRREFEAYRKKSA